MHKYIGIIVLVLSFTQVSAQQDKSIETTIRELENKVVQGILKADSNLLKEVWSPEFLVNTPRNDIAKGREAVFQNQKLGLINYSSFDRTIEEIQIQGTTVITMGSEVFVSRTDIPGAKAGQPVKRRFTNIWLNKNGKWQQVARHASIICL